ncbi:MAG: hydroxyacid dehydrogenase [Lachnospiraceae bacterium]|nr:hydroxyacid dehydrogenase [Lachnospiraceae bacterium]
MKILAIEKEGRLQEKTDPKIYASHDITYVPVGSSDEEIIAAGKDAEVIIVDAMGKVTAGVINGLPDLKMIHSDGVGFQGVDVDAAREKGVYVCNCKGMNASAVAEQALMLMLGLLRDVIGCNRGVYEGRQISIKEDYMVKGSLKELADCTIGLYGFGDIAKHLAKFAGCIGARVLYYDVRRASPETEKQYGVTYAELSDMCARADILSIHIPVTPTTVGSINEEFLSKMKKGAYLINTARGELVDTRALIDAIKSGHIAGAGLDTIAGEPVGSDNPIVTVDKEVADKLILSCHIGGITNSSFVRGFGMLWDDIAKVEKGERPGNIVNKL